MDKLLDTKDSYKMMIIYFITTIISMIVAGFVVVEHEFIKSELKNYLWVLIIFTISFLVFIRLFRVRFKSVLIFLGIIMFLLLFVLINLDFFVSIGSTPDDGMFPIMFNIAFYTTLPFQTVINTLIGYGIENLSYIVVPVYMLMLSFLSYTTIKFKGKSEL